MKYVDNISEADIGKRVVFQCGLTGVILVRQDTDMLIGVVGKWGVVSQRIGKCTTFGKWAIVKMYGLPQSVRKILEISVPSQDTSLP